MHNITLSAPKAKIDQARERARRLNTTLNEEFRRWLDQYVGAALDSPSYAQLMDQLGHVQSSGPYTREQANER